MAVLFSQVCIVSARLAITIFNPVAGVIDGSCSKIDANDIFKTNGFVQLNPLIGSHVVVFNTFSCQFFAHRTFFFGANAILPVVSCYVISTWPTHIGNLQFSGCLDKVFVETVFISQARIRIV